MMPSESGVRRALSRAERAQSLSPAEAEILLRVRGEDLDRLVRIAGAVRDVGLAAAGRPATVTYSRNVFVPVTRLCRNHCSYCTFTATPAALARKDEDIFLAEDEVMELVARGRSAGCKEALITLGDRPEDRWPQARAWLESRGHTSTLSYVRELALRILQTTGLLPHINPGVMSWEEINRLKPVAPSLGMMLETTSERLFETAGAAHHGSIDKEPGVRLQVLRDAGRLAVPFTTGILVGIGETPAERVESLFALRRISLLHGNLQEIIVQNFRAKPGTAMGTASDLEADDYLATVAVARVILGPSVRIQAPPNLSEPQRLPDLLAAGVDDWGGISPVTEDHVNPERPWPQIEELARISGDAGFALVERLAVHPEYVQAGDPWLDPRIAGHVRALAEANTGLANPAAVPRGLPWQDPDPDWGVKSLGDCTVVTEAVDDGTVDDGEEAACENRAAGDRAAGDRAAGDRAAGDRVADITACERTGRSDTDCPGTGRTAAAAGRTAPERIEPETADALRRAEHGGADLSPAQALALAKAQGPALRALAELADGLRRETVGDDVTYVINRNINFSNICYSGCKFCAYAQRHQDPDALRLSLEDIAERVREAWRAGATEICMQGGIDPYMPANAYFDLARTVKASAPQIHLHAFSPMEVMNGATRTGLSVAEWLQEAKENGLDSIPGTAAEILDDDVRWLLTAGKLPTSAWIQVISTAHAVGVPTSSTMMFGHVDTPEHWVTHLRVLAKLQRESLEHRDAAITEFVPLPFVHNGTPLFQSGGCRPGPTMEENVRVHALARVMLHGLIPHVQTSWVKLGTQGAQTMLRSGADDLGGTLMEEAISRMAGARHGTALTQTQLRNIVSGMGRTPRQRTTLYGVPARDDVPFPSAR